jgi:hypothetical protein
MGETKVSNRGVKPPHRRPGTSDPHPQLSLLDPTAKITRIPKLTSEGITHTTIYQQAVDVAVKPPLKTSRTSVGG